MDVINTTGRNIDYEVSSSSSSDLPRFGSLEAAESEARAELDIQAGRYETFGSAQELIEALQRRIAGSPPGKKKGDPRWPRLYYSGALKPHTYVHLVAPAKPLKVEFFESGRLIASVSFAETPDRVVVHEGDGRLWADVEGGRNNCRGVSHAG